MTSPGQVKHELVENIEVLLLLVFMVAGIYFMKQLLLFIYQNIVGIRSKSMLSLVFCFAAAFLSAFLDALTVIAVVISVAVGAVRYITKSLLDKAHMRVTITLR